MASLRSITFPQYPQKQNPDSWWTVWQNLQYLANQLTSGQVFTVAVAGGRGPDITAANSIAVTNSMHNVNGTTVIKNITGASDGAIVVLRAASSIINFDSTGNILATGAAGTRAVPQNAAITLAYNGTSWFVAGVGS